MTPQSDGPQKDRPGRGERPVRRTEICHPNEEEHLLRYGWALRIMHHDACHGPADFRTFGLLEKFGHPELQLYYPLSPGLAVSILGTAVDLIKAGVRFKDGDTSSEVLHNFPVRFVAATAGGKEILRLILPDKQGRVDKGKISGNYALQYEQLHELP